MNSMESLCGLLLGAALGGYSWLLLGRLARFYASGADMPAVLRCLLAVVIGFACSDIWSAVTMAALHLGAFFLLTDGANAILRLLCRRPLPRWRRLYGSGLLPVVLFLCLMVYGSINMNRVVQTDYTITTEKAIREEGYRIAFLSDLHYGTVQDDAVLRDSIARINAQEPDIVILGGDIVEEGTSREAMREVFCHLGALEAPLGIYFVYGNHDRQTGSAARTYTDEELTAAIEENGIRILEDEAYLINGELLLIGRADAAWDTDAARREIGELTLDAPDEAFWITLDHQPLEAEENAAAGIDLMLSGHTHAGQIFPVGYLTELTGGLNYGLYRTGSCRSIVSSGFAGWGYGIRTQAHCEYVIVNIDAGA